MSLQGGYRDVTGGDRLFSGAVLLSMTEYIPCIELHRQCTHPNVLLGVLCVRSGGSKS